MTTQKLTIEDISFLLTAKFAKNLRKGRKGFLCTTLCVHCVSFACLAVSFLFNHKGIQHFTKLYTQLCGSLFLLTAKFAKNLRKGRKGFLCTTLCVHCVSFACLAVSFLFNHKGTQHYFFYNNSLRSLRLSGLVFFITFCAENILAQQNPQYTQYMYNLRSINPGYMVNEVGIVEVGGIYRTQWSGITGAPKTGNLFASVPLRSKLELGVNFFTDKIGSNIQLVDNNFTIDVAYKVKLSKKLDISFGLKTGANSIRLNPFNSNVADDPLFNGNTSATLFNLGAGIFIFNNTYYFGLSTPNFLQNSLTSTLNDSIYTNSVHFYAIGGYVFQISDDVKVKPSFVIKHTNGAPLSFDISANVLLFNKFELGIANRNQDAFSALTSFYVTPNFRIGYAYDFGVSNLKDFNTGSHELMLLYRFDILGLTKKYMSPRFY